MTIRWVEISTACERERMTALSEILTASGVANEVEFREIKLEEFTTALKAACAEFGQIRIGGAFCELAAKDLEKLPSTILTLKAIDSFVKQQGQWWPRNFLFEGILHSLVADTDTLDLSGAAFILGATGEARAMIGALVRIGFKRFTICDLTETKAQALVAELSRSYFSVQFQSVSRQFLTQLPGVHSIAVNTVKQGEDDGVFAELFYFNFLKPSGVWLDMPMKNANSLLEAEAKAVGAFIESPLGIFRCADQAWAKACFGVELDPIRHLELLKTRLKS